MEIQVESLKKKIDALQKAHGHPDYTALYGTGCINRPDLFLVFMNPTARNISVQKTWKGLKASWLGTKNLWKFLHKLGLIDRPTFDRTQTMRPSDWDATFCCEIYTELAKKRIFITNLARSTQPDARPLSNTVYNICVPIMEEEISIVRPKTIITFGNQVSSALLGQPIKVSESRRKRYEIEIDRKKYSVYPTYYPVGMGMMNMGKAIEDIEWIRSQ